MERRDVVSEDRKLVVFNDILPELGLELDGRRVGEEDGDFSRNRVVHDRVVLEGGKEKASVSLRETSPARRKGEQRTVSTQTLGSECFPRTMFWESGLPASKTFS